MFQQVQIPSLKEECGSKKRASLPPALSTSSAPNIKPKDRATGWAVSHIPLAHTIALADKVAIRSKGEFLISSSSEFNILIIFLVYISFLYIYIY